MNGHGYRIGYRPEVIGKDLRRLDTAVKRRIRHAIETRLMTRPEQYGLPLRGSLQQFWKLRVGDYRIVYEIPKEWYVRILVIAHRKDVYTLATARA